MAITLLSFLGGNRGKDKSQPAYNEALYCFKNKQYKSALFAEALLMISEQDVSQVIIFGTKTSIWEYLIPEETEEELYLDIISEVDTSSGISKATLLRCETSISAYWKCPVKLYAGESGITDDNASQEMINYVDILSDMKPENDILLDVTHGFRTMPVLLMSALQYQYALTGKNQFNDYRLTYGEYNHNASSPMHFLDSLSENFAIADASQLFFDKFESEALDEFIRPVWESGAKAIKNLSVMIQGNYLIQLDERVRQLKNALDKKPQDAPPWFERIYQQIEILYQQLNAPTHYGMVLNLSEMLMQRHFNAQAVLGLLLGYEIYICYYFQEPDSVGRYDSTRNFKERFKGLLKDDYQKNKEIIKQINALNDTRNIIAHSGGERKNGAIPNPDNLKAQYARYKKMMAGLLKDYKPTIIK